MSKRKRTLVEIAHRAMTKPHQRFVGACGGVSELTHGYTWGFVDGYLAGYRAGKREGRATAMEDCGWGAGRRSRE